MDVTGDCTASSTQSFMVQHLHAAHMALVTRRDLGFKPEASPTAPDGRKRARRLTSGSKGSTVQLTAAAFKPGSDIPAQFTCDDSDVSPALSWSTPPEHTQTFALVMEDPDAPGRTWVHWVLYEVPATEHELPEGVAPKSTLPSGARQGRNDFGKIGYGGPCPPPGPAHRYYFKLYALEGRLDLRAGATRAQLDRSMRGHILAQAELMGRYRRQA